MSKHNGESLFGAFRTNLYVYLTVRAGFVLVVGSASRASSAICKINYSTKKLLQITLT